MRLTEKQEEELLDKLQDHIHDCSHDLLKASKLFITAYETGFLVQDSFEALCHAVYQTEEKGKKRA